MPGVVGGSVGQPVLVQGEGGVLQLAGYPPHALQGMVLATTAEGNKVLLQPGGAGGYTLAAAPMLKAGLKAGVVAGGAPPPVQVLSLPPGVSFVNGAPQMGQAVTLTLQQLQQLQQQQPQQMYTVRAAGPLLTNGAGGGHPPPAKPSGQGVPLFLSPSPLGVTQLVAGPPAGQLARPPAGALDQPVSITTVSQGDRQTSSPQVVSLGQPVNHLSQAVNQLGQPVNVNQLSRPVMLNHLGQPIDVSQLSQAISMSQLSQAVNVSQLSQAISVSQLSQAVNVSQLSQAINVSQLSQPVNVNQLSQPVNVSQPVAVSQLSQVINVNQLSQAVNVSQLSQAINVSQLSQPVAMSQLSQPVSVEPGHPLTIAVSQPAGAVLTQLRPAVAPGQPFAVAQGQVRGSATPRVMAAPNVNVETLGLAVRGAPGRAAEVGGVAQGAGVGGMAQGASVIRLLQHIQLLQQLQQRSPHQQLVLEQMLSMQQRLLQQQQQQLSNGAMTMTFSVKKTGTFSIADCPNYPTVPTTSRCGIYYVIHVMQRVAMSSACCDALYDLTYPVPY